MLPDLDDLGVALAEFREGPEECRGVLVMAADAAIFRDHFPGEPLLPAVGLLDLCRSLIARWQGPEARLAGLRRVRLAQAVRPPARLEIELRAKADGRLAMSARSRAGEHAAGDLAWQAGAPTAAAGPASGAPASRPPGRPGPGAGPPPGPGCLPHGPGMRLVAGVVSHGGEGIVCACRIPAAFPWGCREALPPYLALEGVAQAAGVLGAAAADGVRGGAAGDPPRRGYITRIREASFPGPWLDPRAPWLAEVAVVGRSGGLLLCRGTAWQAGRALLEARLGLYLEEPGQSR